MSRGLSPVVSVCCLVVVTVGLAAVVGAAVPMPTVSEPDAVAFAAEADPGGEIRLTHRGGDAIDPADLSLRIEIEGEPLAEQPPVPFFSAAGFEPGPTGAFNSATGGRWRAGETATLRVASTNAPAIEAGDTVTIAVFVDEQRVATLEVTA